jgi:hypothetical protein
MNNLLPICATILLLILPGALSAETITFSEGQLNKQLAETFPIVKSYQGLTVSFTAAKVKLDVLDKTLKIDTLIVAELDDQLLTANGLLFGPLEYDDVTQEILMLKPKLEEFYVAENHMQDADPAIRIIKQTITANLQDIVIIDTKKIEFRYSGDEPIDITISPRGVVISLE